MHLFQRNKKHFSNPKDHLLENFFSDIRRFKEKSKNTKISSIFETLQKLTNSFIELFEPETISKTFIKKRARHNNVPLHKVIGNDLTGLYDYLTAPNIRMKVKHPIFLAMRFSVPFQIFLHEELHSLPVKNMVNNLGG